jgi:hypothetical protein
MNLLQKLFQFFRNLIGPKTIRTPKTITTKLDKIPSSNKLPDKPSSSVQIKQVEQIPETVTLLATKIIVRFCTKDLHWRAYRSNGHPHHFSNGEKSTPKLEPGYVIDANTLMEYEDYPEITKCGRNIVNKLRNEPIYVLSTSKVEFVDKRCPSDKPFADDPKFLHELVLNIPHTGKPRNFDNTLNIFLTSLNVPIYYVMIKSSPEIRRRAQELLQDFPSLKLFDLHHPDSTYLAFTRDTKSTLITSDKDLIKCCTYAPQLMKHVRFHTLLEKIMQPGPIKEMLRKRREYYKDRPQPHWSKGAFNRSNKKGKKKQKNLGKKSGR